MKRSDRTSPGEPARTASFSHAPKRWRLLYIAGGLRVGGWLADSLCSDAGAAAQLEETTGAAAGLARLRDDAFDAVLVGHEPGELDGPRLVEALRAGANEEPALVFGVPSEQEMAAACYEAGADAYLCVNTATTAALNWSLARAVRRSQLERDTRRLSHAERRRLLDERDEAGRLLGEQRSVVDDLLALRRGAAHAREGLPEELVAHYGELLRAHVIMGSGNLAREAHALAELFVAAEITAPRAMRLHLAALEELVAGLGNRSTRHVMTRADLLILEVLAHLAEGYRQRYRDRKSPPRQLHLPGFANERDLAEMAA